MSARRYFPLAVAFAALAGLASLTACGPNMAGPVVSGFKVDLPPKSSCQESFGSGSHASCIQQERDWEALRVRTVEYFFGVDSLIEPQPASLAARQKRAREMVDAFVAVRVANGRRSRTHVLSHLTQEDYTIPVAGEAAVACTRLSGAGKNTSNFFDPRSEMVEELICRAVLPDRVESALITIKDDRAYLPNRQPVTDFAAKADAYFATARYAGYGP